ncbi:hypothetical protein AX16_002863 [Volvariella volvacea WC 439]|nr:hypothetical protein AX16_002863 [Volvariella volvacea WC 439]
MDQRAYPLFTRCFPLPNHYFQVVFPPPHSVLNEITSGSTNVPERIVNFRCFKSPSDFWVDDLERLVLAVSPLEQLTMRYYKGTHQDHRRVFNLRYLDRARSRFDAAFITQSLVTLILQDLDADSLPSVSGFYKLLSSLTNLRYLVLEAVLKKAMVKEQLSFSTPGVYIAPLYVFETFDEPKQECARILSHIATANPI